MRLTACSCEVEEIERVCVCEREGDRERDVLHASVVKLPETVTVCVHV